MAKIGVPKTRVQASILHSALKDVAGIVEGRNTIPIMANVVLRIADQQITVTATDMDLWAVRTCASADRDGPASREWLDAIRPFAVCLPAKPLEAVLAALDGAAMVKIEAPAEVNDQWAGQVVVSAGKARFKLHALPVQDFPLLPPFDADAEFEMSCSHLVDTLAGVDHAISSEETRYYLNGVFLHPAVHGDVHFVTTDGSRLARWSIDGPVGSTSFPDAIVSTKTVEVLEKLLATSIKAAGKDAEPPTVMIEAHGLGARLRFSLLLEGAGEVEIVAKTIDGTFPDYTRVIPHAPEHRATMDRSTLAEVVKRVSVLAEKSSRAVKLAFAEDIVTISARSAELGEASEELDCIYDGPAFELGFDSKYLREALSAIGSDTVALRFDADADASGPVRLAGWENQGEVGALLQVLMPVRI